MKTIAGVLVVCACGSSAAPHTEVGAVKPVPPAVAAPVPPPPPTAAPFDRAKLPTWTALPLAAGATAEPDTVVFAVDADERMLSWLAGDRSFVSTASTKRLTGQLHATAGTDAFATLAKELGIDATPIALAGKGKPASYQLVDAPFGDAVGILADVGGMNVVTAPPTPPHLTLRFDSVPWDQAIELCAARVDRHVIRDGATWFVVEKNAALPAVHEPVAGDRIFADVRNATIAQITTGMRGLGITGGSCSTTRLTQKLRHVTRGTLIRAFEVASGAAMTSTETCAAKPLGDEPLAELTLVGIFRQGATHVAVIEHGGETLVADAHNARIKGIVQDGILFNDGTNLSFTRRPSNNLEPAQLTRVSAWMTRGDTWAAVLETKDASVVVSSKDPYIGQAGDVVEPTTDGVRVVRDGVEIASLKLAPR